MNGKKHTSKKRIHPARSIAVASIPASMASALSSASLPPHTWEAHPKTNSGETNKTFLIVLISIALVIILILFLFIGSKFVGKAYTTEFGNKIDGEMGDNGILTITATLTPRFSTGSIYLELTSPTDKFNLCANAITSSLWNQFREVQCTNNHLIFADATLNDADFRTGEFEIVQLRPDINDEIQEVTLSLDVVDMYDAVTGSDLFPGSGTIEIIVPAVLDVCTENNLNACISQTECTNYGGIWADIYENDEVNEQSCV